MSAGSIILDLLLRTGSFETDTDRAAKKVKSFEKQVSDTAGTVIKGFAAIGAAAGSAFALVEFAQFGGQFQELGQKIGDTAASVAALTPAAATSDTAIGEVVAASIKLTKALSETNDESDKTALALKAINIPLAQFRELTPTEQLRAVGKEFNIFADGAGKTAVATALFGKAGAELIPFLHDLGEQQKSSISLTNEQIAALDKFTDTIALAKNETKTLGAIIASNVIPPIQEFLDVLKDSGGKVAAFTAIGEAIRLAFEAIVILGSDVAFTFKAVGREIAAVAAQLHALATLDIKGFHSISDAVKEDGERARKELDDFQRRILGASGLAAQRTAALGLTSGTRGPLDANDARANRQINFRDTGSDDKKAQAFLDRLKQQAVKLEQNEFASLRIEAAQLKIAAAAEPWIKRLEDAKNLQESIKLFIEDATKAEERRAAIGNIQVDLSKQLKDAQFENDLIGKTKDQVEALTSARNVDKAAQEAIRGKEGADITAILALYEQFAKNLGAVIDKRQELARQQDFKVLNFGFGQELDDIRFATELIGKTQEQVGLLTAARQVDRREAQATFGLEGQALTEMESAYERFRAQIIGATDDQQKLAKAMQPFIDTAKQFGETIAGAFESAIIEGKSFSDILQQLEKDLLHILLRNFITQPLGNAITNAFLGLGGGGGSTSGGGFVGPPTDGGLPLVTGQSARREPTWTKTAAAKSGDLHITNNIDARGATDPAAIDRALKASEARSKAAFLEARARNPAYSQ